MSTAHNKLTKDEVDKYCQSNDIRFIDDEYVSNAFKHRWYCNKCCRTVTQRLDKIKRANGTLKCCSRTLASVNKAYSIAEKFNLIFHRESFINATGVTMWTCPLHGTFDYPLSFSNNLAVNSSICSQCRTEHLDSKLHKDILKLKEIVPNVTFIDSRRYKSSVISYKWKCEIHNYETTSRYYLILRNKRLKCCSLKSRSGANHHNWNPSISDEKRIAKRHYSKSFNWSKKVRARDKWACVLCGDDKKSVAHHLYSYMAHPEHRYDVNNGVTLCRFHHVDFHKKYGTTTTPDDFNSYKEKI